MFYQDAIVCIKTFLPKNVLLKTRLICKLWKHDVYFNDLDTNLTNKLCDDDVIKLGETLFKSIKSIIIDLKETKLTEKSLEKLINLESLTVYGCCETMPKLFFSNLNCFPNLKKLNLISGIDFNFDNIFHPGLQKLTITWGKGNPLKLRELKKFVNLKKIDILLPESCNENQFISRISKMSNVKNLNLAHMEIKDINMLTGLEKLNISHCMEIRNEDIEKLINLKTLRIKCTYITSVKTLVNLTKLKAQNTNLNEDGLLNCHKLTYLKLGGRNNVKIDHLKDLSYLCVMNDNFDFKQVEELINLKTLIIYSGNENNIPLITLEKLHLLEHIEIHGISVKTNSLISKNIKILDVEFWENKEVGTIYNPKSIDTLKCYDDNITSLKPFKNIKTLMISNFVEGMENLYFIEDLTCTDLDKLNFVNYPQLNRINITSDEKKFYEELNFGNIFERNNKLNRIIFNKKCKSLVIENLNSVEKIHAPNAKSITIIKNTCPKLKSVRASKNININVVGSEYEVENDWMCTQEIKFN